VNGLKWTGEKFSQQQKKHLAMTMHHALKDNQKNNNELMALLCL